MAHVRSAALNFLVPAGCVYDPPDRLGVGAVLLRPDHPRGRRPRQPRTDAGPGQPRPGPQRKRRQRAHALLGRHRWPATCPPPSKSTPTSCRRPHLPEDEIDAVRRWPCKTSTAWRTSRGTKVLIELRTRALSRRRSARTAAAPPRASPPHRRRHPQRHYQRLFRPRGTILSVAGNIEWAPLRDQVGRLFGDWKGDAPPPLTLGPRGEQARPPRQGHDADADRHRLSQRADRRTPTTTPRSARSTSCPAA